MAGVNCNMSERSLVTEEAVIRALSASSVENLDRIEMYLVSGMVASQTPRGYRSKVWTG